VGVSVRLAVVAATLAAATLGCGRSTTRQAPALRVAPAPRAAPAPNQVRPRAPAPRRPDGGNGGSPERIEGTAPLSGDAAEAGELAAVGTSSATASSSSVVTTTPSRAAGADAGAQAADPTTTPAESEDDRSSAATWWWLLAAALALVIAGGIWLARTREQRTRRGSPSNRPRSVDINSRRRAG
jgi:hypothetical protein